MESNYSWAVVGPLQCKHILNIIKCWLNVLCCSIGDIVHQSPGNLEPQHLKMLLSCLQTSNNPSDRCRILLTLGNAAAFTVNQVQ